MISSTSTSTYCLYSTPSLQFGPTVGVLREFVSVQLHPTHKCLNIASDSGRVCRPLLVVEGGRMLLTEQHMEELAQVSIYVYIYIYIQFLLMVEGGRMLLTEQYMEELAQVSIYVYIYIYIPFLLVVEGGRMLLTEQCMDELAQVSIYGCISMRRY